MKAFRYRFNPGRAIFRRHLRPTEDDLAAVPEGSCGNSAPMSFPLVRSSSKKVDQHRVEVWFGQVFRLLGSATIGP